jgi:hypothetical protein
MNNSRKRNKKEAGGSDKILIIIHSLPPHHQGPAAASTNTAMGKDISESVARTRTIPPPTPSLFNLHEYLQPPVFDQLEELNKLSDRKKDKKYFAIKLCFHSSFLIFVKSRVMNFL